MSDKFDLGARLKQVRQAAGLSQRALAQRAGVPHGQISLVENNRSSPTIASLRKILEGVPTSMRQFFEDDGKSDEQVFFTQQALHDLTSQINGHGETSAGAIVLRQVGDARAHNLQLMHERYEPGADTGGTMLEHEAHEGGIVIAGEIEVTVGPQRQVLKVGDAYLFDSRVPHRFRNVGHEVAIIISACSPPYL